LDARALVSSGILLSLSKLTLSAVFEHRDMFLLLQKFEGSGSNSPHLGGITLHLPFLSLHSIVRATKIVFAHQLERYFTARAAGNLAVSGT
jgi:hypothetical protein